MGILDKFGRAIKAFREPEQRHTSSIVNPKEWLLNISGGGGSISGVPVTGDTALALPAVWSAVRLLSETLATLPIELIETVGDERKKIQDDPGLKLLRMAPNDFSIPFTFQYAMMASTLLWGNGFAIINKTEGGIPIELIPLRDWDVNATKIDGEIMYTIHALGMNMIVPSDNMLHFVGPTSDGIFGRSVIRTQAEGLSMGLAAQKYGKRFFEEGTNIDGYLAMKTPLDATRKKALVDAWNTNYSGFGTSGTAILDNEGEYKRLNMPNEDAQFLETREFSVAEIARMFRVPLHKLYVDSGDAKANIEQKSIDYVIDSVLPWIARYEQEYNRKLLRESQKDNRSYKYNLNALLRGDSKSRGEFYKLLFAMGVISADEIRALEDMNPTGTDEGKARFIPLNVIDASISKEFYQASIDSKTTNEIQNGNNQE